MRKNQIKMNYSSFFIGLNEKTINFVKISTFAENNYANFIKYAKISLKMYYGKYCIAK